MALVGITNPFGEHGEYWDFYQHWQLTFKLLDPILSTGDIKKAEDFISGLEKADGMLLSSDLYNGNNVNNPIPASWRKLLV
jgi:hypothetical protein